ncbi:MAG: hypothetical protein GF398_00160 [Chitinivibrionales bacterium]|nr:hypothetical protein [Chitinivibrionales bacterium]
MKPLTYLSSALLILLGLIGYFGWQWIGADKQSATALVPALVGSLMLCGGLVAIRNNMVGMHIAVLFAGLGALTGLGRLVPAAIAGKLQWLGPSAVLISLMTAICLLFAILSIRSFVDARKNRNESFKQAPDANKKTTSQ